MVRAGMCRIPEGCPTPGTGHPWGEYETVEKGDKEMMNIFETLFGVLVLDDLITEKGELFVIILKDTTYCH